MSSTIYCTRGDVELTRTGRSLPTLFAILDNRSRTKSSDGRDSLKSPTPSTKKHVSNFTSISPPVSPREGIAYQPPWQFIRSPSVVWMACLICVSMSPVIWLGVMLIPLAMVVKVLPGLCFIYSTTISLRMAFGRSWSAMTKKQSNQSLAIERVERVDRLFGLKGLRICWGLLRGLRRMYLDEGPQI